MEITEMTKLSFSAQVPEAPDLEGFEAIEWSEIGEVSNTAKIEIKMPDGMTLQALGGIDDGVVTVYSCDGVEIGSIAMPDCKGPDCIWTRS